MTFITSDLEKVSTENSNDNLAEVAYNTNTDVVTASSKTTITLGSSASTTLDAYTDMVIEIITGNATGQSRVITAYPATTKVATLSNIMTLQPTVGDRYVIHANSGELQLNSHKDNVHLNSTASSIDNFYQNCFIKILYGNNKGKIKKITQYDGTSKYAITDTSWNPPVTIGEYYAIYGESGTASSGLSNTIELDGNQSASVIPGMHIEIYSGTGVGQIRKISNISVNTVTITPNWLVVPDNTSRYTMYSGWGGEYEDVSSFSLLTVVSAIDTGIGESGIIDMRQGLTSNGSTRRGKYTELSKVYKSSVHALTVVSKYFQLGIIGMGYTITGSAQLIYHKTKSGKLSSFIGENINDSNDCELTRAVIVAETSSGSYKNIRADTQNNLNTRINKPLDIFGNISVSQMQNIIEISFLYNTNTDVIKPFYINSGNISQASSMINVSTGVTTGSYSTVQSRRFIKYNPGMGISARFTAVFTEPIADTTQIVGVGNQNNGFFIGYNGVDFGILHRKSGFSQIYTLTITSASTGAGTIVLTLNGESINITVGASDSTTTIARIVANTDLLNVGDGWFAYEDGDDVIFISNTSGLKTGTYSLTLGTATGVAGSFTLLQNGVTAIDLWAKRTEWNNDRVDGTSVLPVIDFTKGNVYKISYQWLGFGRITFEIEDPDSGLFEVVHQIKYANSATTPSVDIPNLPFNITTTNGPTTDNITIKTASVGISVEGKYNPLLGIRNSASSFNTQNLTTGERRNILTIRNNIIYNNKENTSEILLTAISFGYVGTKSALIRITKNSLIDGITGITWNNVDINRSIVSYTDEFHTATIGTEIFAVAMSTTGTNIMDLTTQEIYIAPNDTVSILIEPLTGANGTEFSASISWIERQ